MRTQKLNDKIFLFIDDQRHHENVVVIWTGVGPVVVDAFRSPGQFAAVEKHILERGFKQPVLQIYSHWHPDHTMGNHNLAGLPCVAHKLTWDYIEKAIGCEPPDDESLSQVFSSLLARIDCKEAYDQERVLNVGGTTINLLHAPGHTPDSSLVYVPEYNLVIAGDNLVGPEVEFYFPPLFKGEPKQGLELLPVVYKQIRLLKPKIIIPGHGWVLPPEEIISLNEHRFKNVIRRTKEIIQRGLQLPGSGSSDPTYGENIIRAWLGQANVCATMEEQEALKQNVSRVLHHLSETFDQAVLHSELNPFPSAGI